jgi:hypothetical protein
VNWFVSAVLLWLLICGSPELEGLRGCMHVHMNTRFVWVTRKQIRHGQHVRNIWREAYVLNFA